MLRARSVSHLPKITSDRSLPTAAFALRKAPKAPAGNPPRYRHAFGLGSRSRIMHDALCETDEAWSQQYQISLKLIVAGHDHGAEPLCWSATFIRPYTAKTKA